MISAILRDKALMSVEIIKIAPQATGCILVFVLFPNLDTSNSYISLIVNVFWNWISARPVTLALRPGLVVDDAMTAGARMQRHTGTLSNAGIRTAHRSVNNVQHALFLRARFANEANELSSHGFLIGRFGHQDAKDKLLFFKT